MADTHPPIIREIQLQTVRNLLWAPHRGPFPVRPVRFVQSFPRRCFRASNDRAVLTVQLPRQTLLHVIPKLRIGHQFGYLGPFRGLLCLPLRDPGSIDWLAAPSGGIAPELAGNRPRITAEPSCNITHSNFLGL